MDVICDRGGIDEADDVLVGLADVAGVLLAADGSEAALVLGPDPQPAANSATATESESARVIAEL
jgi:hypothetical protein